MEMRIEIEVKGTGEKELHENFIKALEGLKVIYETEYNLEEGDNWKITNEEQEEIASIIKLEKQLV